MSKDTAELERDNAKLNEVAVNLQRSRGELLQENAKLRMVLRGIANLACVMVRESSQRNFGNAEEVADKIVACAEAALGNGGEA